MDAALAAVVDVIATTPHVMFCVKSTDGTYLAANRAFAERAGLAGAGEVVGRSAGDLFPAELASRYEAQDELVFASGRVLTNELEFITRPDGSIGWFLTSKSRWVGEEGQVQGLVSVSVDLRTPADAAAPHAQLAAAVDSARRRFAEPVAIAELAEVADMTIAQLERASRRVLGLSPKQLLLRFRVEEGIRLLASSDQSIATIAARCGYYDQAAFSRHFKRVVGTSPSVFRRSRARRPG